MQGPYVLQQLFADTFFVVAIFYFMQLLLLQLFAAHTTGGISSPRLALGGNGRRRIISSLSGDMMVKIQ